MLPNSQSWTPEQRRQQICEFLRNKGIICRDFLLNGSCPRSPTCPYMHIRNGETRLLPCSVCTFFNKSVCLRDRCAYFHGTQSQLDELRARGCEVYRPQDYMRIGVPPPQYLDASGRIIDADISFATAANPVINSMPQPTPATAAAGRPPMQLMQPASIEAFPQFENARYEHVMIVPSTTQTQVRSLLSGSVTNLPQVQYQYIAPQQRSAFTAQPTGQQPAQQQIPTPTQMTLSDPTMQPAPQPHNGSSRYYQATGNPYIIRLQ